MLGRLRRTGISIPQLSRCLKSWSGWAAWDCGTSWVSARRNNGGRYNLSLKAMFDHARSILKDALFWCCQTCCWLWNFWRFRLLASSVSVSRWKSLLNLLDLEAQNRRLAFEIIHFLIFDLVFFIQPFDFWLGSFKVSPLGDFRPGLRLKQEQISLNVNSSTSALHPGFSIWYFLIVLSSPYISLSWSPASKHSKHFQDSQNADQSSIPEHIHNLWSLSSLGWDWADLALSSKAHFWFSFAGRLWSRARSSASVGRCGSTKSPFWGWIEIHEGWFRHRKSSCLINKLILK